MAPGQGRVRAPFGRPIALSLFTAPLGDFLGGGVIEFSFDAVLDELSRGQGASQWVRQTTWRATRQGWRVGQAQNAFL